MPFTLVIQPWRDRGGEEPIEKQFEQSHVTIGRAMGCDLVLNDPRRMISSRHAEIRAKGRSWFLVDVGSTNGTELNNIRLTPDKEYPLSEGDSIALGSFRLTFLFDKPASSLIGDDRSAMVSPAAVPAGNDTQRLLYFLRRAYADATNRGQGNVGGHLEAVLRHSVAGLDRSRTETVVASVRQQLLANSCSSKHERPNSLAVSPPRPVAQPQGPIQVAPAVELFDVIKKFCGESDHPLSKSELEQVVLRLIRTLEIIFDGLAGAVKGRREFQKEFEVEATRILSWKPNPIKQAENAWEIGAILLNPRLKGLTDEQAANSLKEIFQDLTLHQLGLLAGFRECIRGLMKELDPEEIAKPPKGQATGKGIGLLGGGNVRAEAAAWRRYLEKYGQLREEEVKVFERILAPHFAKGYLSIHKTRRRS